MKPVINPKYNQKVLPNVLSTIFSASKIRQEHCLKVANVRNQSVESFWLPHVSCDSIFFCTCDIAGVKQRVTKKFLVNEGNQ